MFKQLSQPNEKSATDIHNRVILHVPMDRSLRCEFDAAARRPLRLRLRYAFVHTYKPVLDDEEYRSFESTAEYRRWCDEYLPDWLGYRTDGTD